MFILSKMDSILKNINFESFKIKDSLSITEIKNLPISISFIEGRLLLQFNTTLNSIYDYYIEFDDFYNSRFNNIILKKKIY
jgi:hypothetical protein